MRANSQGFSRIVRQGIAAAIVVLSLVGGFGVGSAPAGASPASSNASRQAIAVVHIGEVVAAERISGNVSTSTLGRFTGSEWTFFADGTFVYAPANARTDIFPVRGTYVQTTPNTYELSASNSTTIGWTGTASTSLRCTLVVGGPSTIECLWATSMGNAAVVNDIRFASAGVSTLYVKATIG